MNICTMAKVILLGIEPLAVDTHFLATTVRTALDKCGFGGVFASAASILF
jgi:hypothetical protein